MPNLENDPTYTNKKRHIGNDYVAIVYSDSPEYKQQIVLVSYTFIAYITLFFLKIVFREHSILFKLQSIHLRRHITEWKLQKE